MGLFNFLKPRKEVDEKPKPFSTVDTAKDYRVLVEMASIISRHNKDVIADFSELVQDDDAFCEKHMEWCEEMLDCVDPQDRHTRLLVIFAYWLTGYDTDFKYGAYIDWKEEPEEITGNLQKALDNLEYPTNIEEITFGENEDTFESLKIINSHLRKQGYTLVILDTNSDCYHLFVTMQEDYIKLQKLGKSVDFHFSTAE